MTKRFTCLLLFVLLIACLCNPVTIFAQVTVDTVEAVTDSTALYDEEYNEEETAIVDTTLQRSTWVYSSDSVQSLKSQKDFAYLKHLDSLLKKHQELSQKEQRKPQTVTRTINVFPIVEMLLWALLIGALLFVLYRIFLSDRGLFASPLRNKKMQVEEEQLTDEVYLEQQLQHAIKEGNYRLGIRFLYLQSLSKLAERGWLQLSPDKTNYQYVRELAKPQLKNVFVRITLHYEYAWYGDFVIGKDIFEPVKKEFDQFHQTIKQS